MINRLTGLLALVALAAFLGVLVWRVPHLDLMIVLAVCFLLAAYDIIGTTWRRRRNGERER